MDRIPILVVEDHPAVRGVLGTALYEAGFALAFADTVEDAISLLGTDGSQYRALVTAVHLSPAGLTGWAVARHARELVPELPVVYLTSGHPNEWAAQGVPKSTVLVKPFVPAQLITALATLLNGV